MRVCRLKRCARLVAFSALAASTAGCPMFFAGDISGWGYVERIGGPKEIGEWTMRQTEHYKVDHGLLGIATYTDEESTEEVAEAADAIAKIIRKLDAGWMDFEPPPEASNITHEHLLRGAYNVLGKMVRYGDARARETLMELEPPVGARDRAHWERVVSRLAKLEAARTAPDQGD